MRIRDSSVEISSRYISCFDVEWFVLFIGMRKLLLQLANKTQVKFKVKPKQLATSSGDQHEAQSAFLRRVSQISSPLPTRQPFQNIFDTTCMHIPTHVAHFNMSIPPQMFLFPKKKIILHLRCFRHHLTANTTVFSNPFVIKQAKCHFSSAV